MQSWPLFQRTSWMPSGKLPWRPASVLDTHKYRPSYRRAPWNSGGRAIRRQAGRLRRRISRPMPLWSPCAWASSCACGRDAEMLDAQPERERGLRQLDLKQNIKILQDDPCSWRTGDLLLPSRATSSCHRCRSKAGWRGRQALSGCKLTHIESVPVLKGFKVPWRSSTPARLHRASPRRFYCHPPSGVDAAPGVCCRLGTMAKIQVACAGESWSWGLRGCYSLTRNRPLQL
jgi:hypothetical protein